MELLHSMSRKLKPSKLFKVLIKPLFRNLFSTAVLQRRHQHFKDDNQAFMTCIIKVNPKKRGWQNGVFAVVNNCQGVRTFEMDEAGSVKISGIADPHKLLHKIGRTRKAKLVWFQYGQCSKNLFMSESKKPAKDEPTHEGTGYGYGPYGYGYYPPVQDGYECNYPPVVQNGYGYNYQPVVQDGYGYHNPHVTYGYPYATGQNLPF